MRRQPRLDARQVVGDDPAGAGRAAAARVGRERRLRQAIAERAGGDRRVVVIGPQRRRPPPASTPPSRRAARAGRRPSTGRSSPSRGRRGPTSTATLGRRARRRDRSRRTRSSSRAARPRPRRASSSAAVRRAPVGLFGVHSTMARVRGPTSDASALEVRAPAARRAILDERPLAHDAAEGAHEAVRLHVGGHEHHHLVAGLHQIPRGEEVGFGAAVGHLDVVGGGARVERGDRLAQRPRCRWSACR